jgi:membrane protein YdbS with pleckstrin-like domain
MDSKHVDPTPVMNQVVTTGLTGPEVAASPPTSADLSAAAAATTPAPPTPADASDPAGEPDPEGTNAAFLQQMSQEAAAKGANAPGVEAEEQVWEGSYSLRNFLGRLLLLSLLTAGCVALASMTWDKNHPVSKFVTIVWGAVMVIAWVVLLYRIVQARGGHHYQLTNRRMFVSTGLFRRRRDQLELLRIKDVFVQQSFSQRWLSLGTVVVVPDAAQLPTFYLAGVDDPAHVMDLVWHCSRAKREGKTVQVENF